jgi:hypothetical protein
METGPRVAPLGGGREPGRLPSFVVTHGGTPLAELESAFRSAFDAEPARASVSFVGVDPIEVLRFGAQGLISYVTLGMSRHVMTPGDALVQSQDGPRAELLMQARTDAGEGWRQLALLAAAPAVEGIVYRDGMTVDLGAALTLGSRCSGGLIVTSAIAPVETSVGAVVVFRVVPATATELAWCRVHGSALLRQRWDEQGVDLLDLRRPAARLD